MFRSRWGVVSAVLAQQDALQELEVVVGENHARAANYVALTGQAGIGDRVLLNTTAVDMGLGSGGLYFVMAIAGREERLTTPPGHLMKLRYTPWQLPVAAIEEQFPAQTDSPYLDGLPVVVGELHSQVAPAVLAARAAAGRPLKVAYVMTDGGALPLAFSRQVALLKRCGLVDVTLTAGHAFGGDHEAVSVHGALVAAHALCGADVVVVAMGPGIAGTGSTAGFSGVEQSWILDAVAALGGRPVAMARLSFADHRPRHQGLSHHTCFNLGRLVRSRVTIPLPHLPMEQKAQLVAQLTSFGIAPRHDVRHVPCEPLAHLLESSPIRLETMGRDYAADPAFFLAAAAAGWVAGEMARRSGA